MIRTILLFLVALATACANAQTITVEQFVAQLKTLTSKATSFNTQRVDGLQQAYQKNID